MSLLFLLFTLIVGPTTAMHDEVQSNLKSFSKKCPHLAGNNILQECLNSPVEDISNITNNNVNNVLCTIYSHNLLTFTEKLSNMSLNICNESLIFPNLNYNATICEKPEFLVFNKTQLPKELSVMCIKLCITWKDQVDGKCALSYYYNGYSLNNHLKAEQTDMVKNTVNEVPVETPPSTKKSLPSRNHSTNSLTPVIVTDTLVENNSFQNLPSQHFIPKSNDTVNSKVPKTSNEKGKVESQIFDQGSSTEKIHLEINDDDQEGAVGNEEADDSAYNDKHLPELPGNDADKLEKPNKLGEDLPVNNAISDMDGESYFFSYFMVVCILFVMGYVFYHNRAKVMALVLEGKRNKRQQRSSRRPNSANYHKLDSNLEEALSSSTCNKNSNPIIY